MPNRDVSIRLSLKDGDTVRRALLQLGNDGKAALAKIEKQSAPASKSLKALNAVSGDLQRGMLTMGTRIGAVGEGLAAMGPAGLAAAAGIGAAVIGAKALIDRTREAVTQLDQIAQMADGIGVTTERFQELVFTFSRFDLEANDVGDALGTIADRAQDAVSGTKSMQQDFQLVGISVDDLRGKKPEQLFDLFAQKVAAVKDPTARTAAVLRTFGDDLGRKLLPLLRQGQAGLDEFAQEARNMGVVIDDSILRRAQGARRELNTMQRVIDANLSAALVDLAPLLVDIAKGFADVAKWVGEAVDGFRSLETISTRGLKSRIDDMSKELAAYDKEIAGIQSQRYLSPADKDRLAPLKRDRERLFQQREQAMRELLDRQASSAQQAAAAASGGGGAGGPDPQQQKIEQVTKSLQFELQQLDRTALGQKTFNALKQAGIDADNAQAQSIAALVRKVYDKEQANQAAADAEKKRQEAEQKGLQLTEQYRTADEQYAQTLRDLDALRKENTISAQTYARAVADAERKKLDASTEASAGIKRAMLSYSEDVANNARSLETAASNSLRSLEDTMVQVATTGKLSFKDMTASIASDFARIGIRKFFTGPISEAIFSAFHEGGTVGGAATMTRSVNPLAFVGAPRFHSGGDVGLRPGERPIIAKDGERVLTEAQQDSVSNTLVALAKSAAARPQVVVQPTTYVKAPGVQARTQTSVGPRGELRIDTFVEEIEQRMGRNIQQGDGLAPTLEGTYGLNRAAGAVR